MTDTPDNAPRARVRTWMWWLVFVVLLAAIAALRLTDRIGEEAGFALLVFAMFFLVPVFRSRARQDEACGAASPARKGYERRMFATSVAYVVCLGIAAFSVSRFDPPMIGRFALATLPAIPIFGMVWAMGRYLSEESDEYLRYRYAMAALCGLGFLLAAGSFWGFLEEFDVAPHVSAWWVTPVWALGMGLGNLWMKARDS